MAIQDNTFAAACYNDNSVEELKSALSNGPDATDLETWDITEEEWVDQVVLAIHELEQE